MIFLKRKNISMMKGLGVQEARLWILRSPFKWAHLCHHKVVWCPHCRTFCRKETASGDAPWGRQRVVYTGNSELSGQLLTVPSGESVHVALVNVLPLQSRTTIWRCSCCHSYKSTAFSLDFPYPSINAKASRTQMCKSKSSSVHLIPLSSSLPDNNWILVMGREAGGDGRNHKTRNCI